MKVVTGLKEHIYWRSTGVSLLLLLSLFYLPLFHFFALAGAHLQFGRDDKSAIWFTVWQGIVVAVITCFISLLGAFLLYRKNFFGVKSLRTLMVIPFFIPGISIAIGFHQLSHWPLYSFLLSRNHAISAVIFAEILVNVPVGLGLIGGTLKGIDRELQESIQMDGASSLQEMWNLTLPFLFAPIKKSLIITFFYSLSNLGIILAIGNEKTNSIESQIYSLIQGDFNLHHIASLAIVQTLISFLTFTTLAGKGFSFTTSMTHEFLPANFLHSACAYIFVFFMTIPFFLQPIQLIDQAMFHWRGFKGLINLHPSIVDTSLTSALFHTLRNAIFAGIFGILIAIGLSLSLSRNSAHITSHKIRRLYSRIVEIFACLPLAFSPLLIGLGFLLTFTSGIFPLRESWISTPIAQSLLGIPLAVTLIATAWKLLPPQFYEEGILSGADSLTYFLAVELPLLRVVITRAFIFLLLISIADFSSAAFLTLSHQGVLTTIFQELISHPGRENYFSASLINLFFISVATTLVFMSERFSGSSQDLN